MANNMEIERDQILQEDNPVLFLQAKAEELLQKRQKCIDELSNSLEKIFQGYLEGFANQFQKKSDELTQLLTEYNYENGQYSLLKNNLQAVQEKTEELYAEMQSTLSM